MMGLRALCLGARGLLCVKGRVPIRIAGDRESLLPRHLAPWSALQEQSTAATIITVVAGRLLLSL